LALGTATFVLPVSAQPADDKDGIDEIVVTARKREEALVDVPFSLAVKTGDDLKNAGAQNLEDIAATTAGFTVQNLGPGQSQVAVRGVSAGQIVRDQPGVKEQVGIYLDESPISLSLFTPDLDLYDLNRVEVLRGPQGTLFGSGSLSGTVRYITNQPNLEETSGQIQLGGDYIDGGDFGGNFKGMVNLPLSDKLAFRVAGYYTRMGGFIDAVQPGGSTKDDVNEGDRWGFRASLLFQPTEDLKITPRVIYQEVDVDGFPRVDRFNILGNQFTTTRPPVNLDNREQFTQLKEKFSDEFFLADLTIEYDLGDLTLTSVTSYSDREVLQVRDATQLTGSITAQPGVLAPGGLGPAIYTLNAPLDDATDVKTFTQELRVAGTSELVDWVAGVFYTDIEREYGQTLFVPGFESATGIGTTTPGVPGTIAGVDNLFISNIPYEFDQFAAFAEGTFHLSEQLDLTLGIRYFNFDEERELNFDGIFAVQTLGSDAKVGSESSSPRAILAYKVSENLTLNAQIAKGFRLGGVNDPLNAPLCSAADLATFGGNAKFKDEQLWNYEVGGRAVLADGRVNVSGAVFVQRIKDLQATLDAGSCSSRVILNVPRARSVGAEVEVAAQVAEGLDVSVSASYTDAELRSNVRDSSGAILAGALKKGNRLPTVPEFQFAAAVNYATDLDNGMEAFATATFQHVGERFTQIGDQAPGFGTLPLQVTPIGAPSVSSISFDPELEAYQTGNLRLGVRKDNWEVAFFINNLWDEEAELALDRERGGRARFGYLTNQPRTFGVTTTIDF
jgi:iron complex outermembrane receptor protein